MAGATRKKKKLRFWQYRKNWIILAAVVIVAAIILGVLLRKKTPSEVEEGIVYLEKLDAQSVSTIEDTLAEKTEERLAAEREEKIKQLTDGTINVWSLFGDSVILGDSRAVGFYYYEFLPQDRVLAAGGNTIRNIEEHTEEIKELNPSSIFFCYGLNDVLSETWSTPEEYAAEYAEILGKLSAEVPHAKMYVNSILPAEGAALAQYSVLSKIPEYTDAVSEMCEKNGYYYIDNTSLAESHTGMYAPDGIHLDTGFYPLWAANMMTTFYQSAGDAEGTAGTTDSGSSENDSTGDSTEGSDSQSQDTDSGDA